MSNDRIATVRSKFSKAAITNSNVVAYLQKEMQPIVDQCRTAINRFMPSPRIPRFGSSPVTDADFLTLDPRVVAQDGAISVSSAALGGDGKTYMRDGSDVHVVIGAP